MKLIIEKAWKRISILRQFKFLPSRKSLERMYYSFIRPLLEYGDVVWTNCMIEQPNVLEAVQIEAATIITGATKLCETNKLYNELLWQKLSDRRHQHQMTFYKMTHNMTPSYLQSLVLYVLKQEQHIHSEIDHHSQT